MAGGESGSRRRWWTRAALIVVIVLLLIGVPVALSMRPWFFSRSDALAAQYGPWKTSSHAEVRCEQCHVPPTVVARTLYRARMVGEFYASLVAPSRVPGDFPAPTNDACLTCHMDLRSVSPNGDLQIPHRAHVNVLKMQCVQCHDFLVHELNPQGDHLPTMDGCLECHDGDTAKATCAACHTGKAVPQSHAAADWLVVHPDKAADPECDSCHQWTDDWCADCHAVRPRSHTEEWRAVHGEQVKRRRNCEACHDGAFCIRCHGKVPEENFDPDLRPVR